MNFNFNTKMDVVHYHGWSDLLFVLGGGFAFLMPLIILVAPCLFLEYQWHLGDTIDDQYEELYRKSLLIALKVLVGKIKTRRKTDNKYKELN